MQIDDISQIKKRVVDTTLFYLHFYKNTNDLNS